MLGIRDVTLRDGLQDERPIPLEAKVRILELLLAAGVRDLEIASFVRPDRVPAMADAAQFAAAALQLGEDGDIRMSALVPNRRGADLALQAGISHLVFVLSVSERHNLGNVGCTVEESFRELASVASSASSAGADVEVVLATAFGCPYEGPVPSEHVTQRALQALGAGAASLTLADTIGTAVPTGVRDLVTTVSASSPDVPIGIHLHDTRGLGIANALAAIDAGVERIDGAVGGLGGCPFAPGASGNLALEDLIDCFEGMAIPSDIDVAGLLEAAELACSLVGKPVTSHIGVAGPRPRLESHPSILRTEDP